jgi:hypothetical protein
MERGGICTKQSTVSCAGHLAIPATSLLAAVQLRCKLQVPVTDRQTSAAPMFGGADGGWADNNVSIPNTTIDSKKFTQNACKTWCRLFFLKAQNYFCLSR